MAYTPTTWNTGDTVTASAMNKLEHGVANAGGASYDGEILVYRSSRNASWVVSLISGTFENITDKLGGGNPPVILVRVGEGNQTALATFGSITYYRPGASVPDFEIDVIWAGAGLQEGFGMVLWWNANDEVIVD